MNLTTPASTTLATQAGDMRQLIDTVAAVGKPHKNPHPDGKHYALVPDGYRVEYLEESELPARPVGVVKLRDAASFIRYFNDHKLPRSRIYGTLDPAAFLAVFDDFDLAGAAGAQVHDQSDWRGFRAEFKVPPSREWLLWNKANRQHFNQLAFAEFLQDNLPDVVQPDGGTLLELALNFESAQAAHFVASQRLQDGSHNLQWKADNNAAGTARLPEFITLQIPVFENEQASEMQARLRYRVKPEGTLAIWFELVRPHKVLEAAFRGTWQRIATEADAVVLLGTPE